MLSQPATKIFMKTAEPKAAEWISEAIGKVEIERLKETKFDGTRSGHNFTVERQIEPLVMGSEISGLDDRHASPEAGQQRRALRLRVHGSAHTHARIPSTQDCWWPEFQPRHADSPSLTEVAPEEDSGEPEDVEATTDSEGPHDKERAPIAWPKPGKDPQPEQTNVGAPTEEELDEEQALGPALIRET